MVVFENGKTLIKKNTANIKIKTAEADDYASIAPGSFVVLIDRVKRDGLTPPDLNYHGWWSGQVNVAKDVYFTRELNLSISCRSSEKNDKHQ